MKNFPYLDKPFIPRAVALRTMLAETGAKIATAAPDERARLQERAEVMREWLTPKSKPSPGCNSAPFYRSCALQQLLGADLGCAVIRQRQFCPNH
jgi:hypothetical protein